MHVALAISVMRYKRTLVRAGGRRMTLDVRVLSNYLLSAIPRGICPSRGNVASTMQCPQWPQSFTQRCTSHITVSQPLTHPCIACIDEIYPLAACLPRVEIGLVACDHRDTTAQVVLLLRSRIAVVYSQSTKADTLEVDKTLQPTHS
jgi:hypothetical protein